MSVRITKTFEGVKAPRQMADELEEVITSALWEIMYRPLFDLIRTKSLILNAFESLKYGLRTGRIVYYRGNFTGTFSVRASRELRQLGASYSGKGFYLRIVPDEIKEIIKQARKAFGIKIKKIEKHLTKQISEKIADTVKTTEIFSKTADKVNRKIDKSLTGVRTIKVFDSLTKIQSKKLVEQYDQNAKLKIKGFTEKQVERLRQKVRENVEAGGRYEDLIEEIKSSYDISTSRAKFLASQETRLLTVELKKIRYTSAGMPYYKWSCVNGSSAHPVRPAHKNLNQTIHSWSDPPITSEPGTPERRNHPGQDYNCRCVAIPVFIEAQKKA